METTTSGQDDNVGLSLKQNQSRRMCRNFYFGNDFIILRGLFCIVNFCQEKRLASLVISMAQHIHPLMLPTV